MKTRFLPFVFLIFLFSCEPESEPDVDPPSGEIYTLTFWSDFQGPPIEVYVNGDYEGQITGIHESNPGCDATRSVSVIFTSPGSVSYYAEDGDYTWDREISISRPCTTVLLTD